MDGSPQTHGEQLEVPQAGMGAGQGLPARCHQCPSCHHQGSVLPRGIPPALCCSSLPTDTAWGRKWGSEAPPKADCAPALGTRGSMGCKQPGEPLRRGVNKGISQTASEPVPAGRRNRTIPTAAHNRAQPSPHRLAGKAGDKGEGATSGDSASLPGGQRGGHWREVAVAQGWDRLYITARLLLHLLPRLSCPRSKGQSVP